MQAATCQKWEDWFIIKKKDNLEKVQNLNFPTKKLQKIYKKI